MDRTLEFLAPSDLMITRVRRMLVQAAKDFKKDGTLPPSASDESLYARVRGGFFIADEKSDWLDASADRIAASPWESVGAAEAAE